ncbi:acyltransferase family protein [Rhizobium leguminosarum]|uniref:acyltransferase family protein n=1 Tax=Rhizobium leguminosarum TaxID=384 RepID=UPI0012F8AF92|nr:acyltransferase [Rhizobium leguminosarum]MVO96957.1 acyltransferase family protein [Rhizobium leguminosarum bv. phaseoli]
MFQRYNFSREAAMIDALRGVAALFVFLSHADSNKLISFEPLLSYKEYLGEIGVYLFFILSGYLIWTSAHRQLPKDGGLFAYFVHRCTRIMPLYYVALLFGIFVFPALSQFPVEISAYAIVRNATFTQSLLPSESRAINPVIWTLTHEMLFYLLVPALFLARRAFPLIAVLAAFGTWWGYAFGGDMFAPFLQLCFLFAIGMTLAQYDLCPTRLAAGLTTLAAILLGVFGFSSMLVSLAWAVALLSMALSLREFRGRLPVRCLAVVGVSSYSLYIWHYMLIEIIGPKLSDYGIRSQHPTLTALGFTAFCIGVSWLSYRLIELPGQTSLRDAVIRRFRTREATA